jgi:hypothetical protein
MKSRLVGLAVIAASTAPIAIVADFRPDHRHRTTRAPLAISDAELLAHLFPTRLSDETKCPPRADDSTLESERALGLVVPRVAAAVAGSFTAPHRHETAVLVHVGECRPYGFEAGGSKDLVILDGAQIVWPSPSSFSKAARCTLATHGCPRASFRSRVDPFATSFRSLKSSRTTARAPSPTRRRDDAQRLDRSGSRQDAKIHRALDDA